MSRDTDVADGLVPIVISGYTQNTGKLLGRGSPGPGDIEEITLGAGLTMTGTELSAPTGGSGTVTEVDLTAPDIFTVSGNPITTSGAIDFTPTDPGADRLVFWDDSAGKWAYLTAGTGLSISGTTITASGAALADGDYGDITASSSGTVLTIDAGVVTLAKMANLAQDQFIGRTTASTGVPETATITAAARTVLDDTTVANMVDTLGGASSTGTGGLVRASGPTFTAPILGTPASGVATNLTGTATALNIGGNAATVTVTDAAGDTTTFVMLAGSATGSLGPLTDAGLAYNATTNVLTAGGFAGPLTGNVTGNLTGNADTVTTNANLTGAITSVGNASVLGSFTLADLNTAISDANVATGGGTATNTNTGDQNLFSTISVSGQSNVVADSTGDTLTLVAGTDITITTNATTDTITINSTGGGGGITLDENTLAGRADGAGTGAAGQIELGRGVWLHGSVGFDTLEATYSNIIAVLPEIIGTETEIEVVVSGTHIKSMTISFVDLATGGSDPICVQLGHSGTTWATSGYNGTVCEIPTMNISTHTNSILLQSVGGGVLSGQLDIRYLGDINSSFGVFSFKGLITNTSNGEVSVIAGHGALGTSGQFFDEVRLTTTNGTDLFASGDAQFGYDYDLTGAYF